MPDYEWPGSGSNGGGRPEIEIDIRPEKILPTLWGVLFLAMLVWAGSSSYFTVEANEEAVVLRLGTVEYVAGPGIHGKLPFGIDRAYKGAVKTVHQAEFGYRTVAAGVKSQFDHSSPEVIAEATMLTGDLNLVLVSWEVRYKIKNLEEFLFEVRDPVATLRDVSEAVMRTEIGDRSVDEGMTLGRAAIETEVKDNMQVLLDGFKAGIHVVKVNLKRLDPPDPVRDAFNAVNRAIQVRDRIINEAEGERNKKIPTARGEKERAIKEAEGYKLGRLNRARVRPRPSSPCSRSTRTQRTSRVDDSTWRPSNRPSRRSVS
ncbi:MAG: FtsH protease activity modulator HflK [Myxococcota bacterium]|nr:FtsH protease activity modulator HflK [Myxococcota bacterium]